MIALALSLALLVGQDAAAAAAPDEEDGAEIVVSATYGRTTMLFDKGSDGKLRNCRVMISSGSQTRDSHACQATPVCFAGTADEVTDCTYFTVQESVADIAPPVTAAPVAVGGAGAATFALPRLVRPGAPPPPAVGPSLLTDSREPDRNRVEKLPPPPTAPTDGPVIRITNAQDQ